MSDYHILGADNFGNGVRVIMHFPVPAGNNEVGMAWQDIQALLWNAALSQVLNIDPAEQAQLDSGELYEHEHVFFSRPSEGLVEKRDALDVAYAAERTTVLGELAQRLDYWGFARDVP